MKNYATLEADVNKLLGKHFTKGRSGQKITYTVIHHNGGNLTVEGCYGVWQTRAASAHYQVESSGRDGQLVNDGDTAWHAGNWVANCRSIGIEHADECSNPWRISEKAIDSGAHLLAAVHKYYGLGRPEWMKNVFPHYYFSSTECPASLANDQRDLYMARAQAYYDEMNGGAAVKPLPEQPVTPTPSKPANSSNFGGTYTCMVNGLRVRTGPGLGYGVVTQYNRGMTVVLDNWYKIVDGYIWGRYTGNSGNVRYIAVGRATGKVESDDFLVKGGTVTPSHQVSQPDLIPAGTYRINVDVLNIRTGPGLGYPTLGSTQYRRGNTVVLDGTEQTADGYVWGRYLGGSGKHRWIAVRTTGGASYANKVA